MKGNSRRSVQLGDLFTIKHGYAFKGEHFGTEGSHIVLTPGNFFDEGGFKKKGDKEKWYSGKIPQDYILTQGDLLVAMTEQAEGLLGSSAFVPEGGRYLHNQRLGLIQNFNGVDKRFLYYLFNSQAVRQQIRASCSGVKVRHTSPSRIYEVKVDIPPLPTQRKIAAILSAYEDLIENNLRRIKILEEMAQNLYREWFVKFRFPGHQHARLTDSPLGQIPEGLEVVKLGEVADVHWGDTSTTKSSYVSDGYTAYSAAGADGALDHYDYDRDGIVLSAIGANCGLTWFASGKWSCIKNTIRFWSSNSHVSTEYLYYATLGKNFWPKRGAAQPFISQGDAKEITIVIPDKDINRQFEDFIKPTLAQYKCLSKKNTSLRRTRDLLLPRLISGEVDVSEMDIAVPEEAVT